MTSNTLVFHRDTPESDIVGINLYQRFVDRLRKRQNNNEDFGGKKADLFDPELPQSRNMPLCKHASFILLTSLLVSVSL